MLKIILPVAGKGTRLRPHTFSKPKSLVKVAGKTVLYHIMEGLLKLPDAQFIFIVDEENMNYIKDYINRKFGIEAEYALQKERLGPAHAVWLAREYVKPGDDILVVFNDTIAITDYTKIDTHCKEWDGIIYVQKTKDPSRFGIVDQNHNKEIKRIVEKPKEFIGDLAVVGAYYFKDGSKFMKACDDMVENGKMEKGEYYMNYAIHTLIENGMSLGAKTVEKWLDCGKPETLLETNQELLTLKNGAATYKNDTCLIIPPVYVPESAKVTNSLIGPYVSVGENAVIDNCKIENSIIDDGAEIKGINLGDSIIGQNAVAVGNARRLNIGDNSVVDLRK